MGTVLSIIIILASILLVVVVLLQPGKGDLTATFGGLGGQMGSMFGMQRTANILQKITRYLAIGILALALLINLFFLYPDQESAQRSNTALSNFSGQAQQPAPKPVQQPAQQNPAAGSQQQPAQQQPAQGRGQQK